MTLVAPGAPVAGVMDLLGNGSFNGLSWGPGTKFHISALSGLHDLPPIRSFDSPRPGDHGRFRGVDLLDSRTVTMDLTIIGDSNADLYVQTNQVAAAFLLQAAELPMTFHNNTRLINARCRRRSEPYEAAYMRYSGVVTLEMLASDPRVYDAMVQNLSSGLAQVLGGMTFNATFNLGFGATGSGGLIQVTNNGTFAVRPVITISGPVDNPVIENITASKKLRFSISLGVSDTLVIDLDARSVLLNGTASRRSAMTSDSQWWEIAPGASTLRFTNSGAYQAAALASFPFRSAWV